MNNDAVNAMAAVTAAAASAANLAASTAASTTEALGDLKARMIRVETDSNEARSDIKAIRSILDQAKGGWKTIALVAGVAGAMGALIAKIVPFIGSLPR